MAAGDKRRLIMIAGKGTSEREGVVKVGSERLRWQLLGDSSPGNEEFLLPERTVAAVFRVIILGTIAAQFPVGFVLAIATEFAVGIAVSVIFAAARLSVFAVFVEFTSNVALTVGIEFPLGLQFPVQFKLAGNIAVAIFLHLTITVVVVVVLLLAIAIVSPTTTEFGELFKLAALFFISVTVKSTLGLQPLEKNELSFALYDTKASADVIRAHRCKVILWDWMGLKTNLMLADEQIEEVDEFVCLSRCINPGGLAKAGISIRIEKASAAFVNLSHLWHRCAVILSIKGRDYSPAHPPPWTPFYDQVGEPKFQTCGDVSDPVSLCTLDGEALQHNQNLLTSVRPFDTRLRYSLI
ncbi:hypothetical protein T265_06162 [Opisthorchis viverrini]|uniref:Uncharacterized protein n=1 Tax=Opisthorchis viverrini TaxID=6198 RepID=A0A074ZLP3_OPIVI|nr:hypothetical protein T265_06162 [Opisthorchis viverrini]KER26662.1 hypothetical protein T265_06162 [Opisthorchis viverrini]